MITPFRGESVDYEGMERLIDFQIQNGISGILAVGTTGESPTLSWEEHNEVVQFVSQRTRGRCMCIAGTGSNYTAEALEASRHAVQAGVDGLLLVDPYYNGPSSLEIRREYIEPIAGAFPDTEVIPYVIPGRTGAQLLPEDLAIASHQFSNIRTVKEATGNLDNMRKTRECCGPDFCILSGDDGLTLKMMTDPEIRAAGVISVLSNLVPGAVVRMVRLVGQGNTEEAMALDQALQPLFHLVTVKTTEKTPYGDVVCRARNPLAMKTLMALLGLPSGGCRRPLGRMTQKGFHVVLDTARSVQANHPELFAPAEAFFGVNMDERLNSPEIWKDLCYDRY
jgi:4-hydroxy-tetrahydrodipicolinate synthase